ncbi:hypothetical protein [Phenylobacterium aquaticum]|uniref:hypothetical protein n=1 Tax=Phenylobacterium aquaticum TaxID=1763816 RepID=UPI001F5C3A34|nr:hypothetical protein [Phenylobacterium aquaticum]MCI3131494.1 hypothetical protein [Phenylobacterium aquaticum]
MRPADENWFDPDIQAMTLGYGEKAGLQIYRNYTRAFEDEGIKRFREALSSAPGEYADFEKLAHLLATEDIRFLPVIACGYADDVLKQVFLDVIPPNVPGGRAEMLSGYGPLSDLSKRIRLAHAFDVLSGDLMDAIDRVRSARNRISHDWDLSKIEEFYLNGRVSELAAVELMLAERAKDFPELAVTFDPASAFRIRLIWLMGRLTYEGSLYHPAKVGGLKPFRALYANGGTAWLAQMSNICMAKTRVVIAAMSKRPAEA